VLLVLLLFTNRLNDYDTGEGVAWWYFLYLHNVYSFVFEASTGPTTHFWSLCVEEQFYVLFPLALLLTPKRHRFALLVSLIVASIATRIALDALLPARRVGAGALLPVAGEYLIWGALFGLIDVRLRSRPVPAVALFVLGVALHGAAVVDQLNFRLLASAGLEHAYQTLHGVGFSLIVFSLWRMPENRLVRLLSVEPLVYLGRISYGLYVYHNFLYGSKDALVGAFPWLAPVPEVAVALAATIGVSVLSWHLFEGPINRLKDRIPYGKPAPITPAVSSTPARRTSPSLPGLATESPSPA
jgi:peptidoglycan/LPS O-acetylase OafA/YrhL